MLQKVEQMKRYLRSKLGDNIPVYVTITMWDDGDYEIVVRHTIENSTQHNLVYHHSDQRLDYYLTDINSIIIQGLQGPKLKGHIPVTIEEVFK